MHPSTAGNSTLNSSTSGTKKTVPEDEQNNFIVHINVLMTSSDSTDYASICKVPDYLRVAKPEVYVPQLLGLGPYHHMRPDLDEMHTYKVVAAKRIHNFHGGFDFNKLIEMIKSKTIMDAIRACYPLNVYMNMREDYLAYMLAIDGLVLFELLVSHMELGRIKDTSIDASTDDDLESKLHKLALSGRAFVQSTALRDLMMLENQIPLQVLKLIMAVELIHMMHFSEDIWHNGIVPVDGDLELFFVNIIGPMLLKIFQVISPFDLNFDTDDQSKKVEEVIDKLKDAHHPLDFMYNMILYINFHDRINETTKPIPVPHAADDNGDEKKSNKDKRWNPLYLLELLKPTTKSSNPEKIFDNNETSNRRGSNQKPPPPPHESSTNILGIQMPAADIGKKLENIGQNKNKGTAKTVQAVGTVLDKAPKVFQAVANLTYDAPYFLLPSASMLVRRGGLIFKPVKHLINLKLDSANGIIYLPSILLNSVTEAVIKNLVIYENFLRSGTLQSQTRQQILSMNGNSSENDQNTDIPEILIGPLMAIMDTLLINVDDVKVLKKAGILKIHSSLEDEQVLTIFNGLSSSVAISKNSGGYYNLFVQQVDDYYANNWKVKARRRFYKFSVASYTYSTALALIILVLLSTLQTLCTIGDCHRRIRFL